MDSILVIGSLNMDMVIHVEEIPKVGQTLLGSLQGYVPGGKGANQAFAAGRLSRNGTVNMLGTVGDDELGVKLIQNLTGAGVCTKNIAVAKNANSGLAVIQVNHEGNNSITVLPGANFECNEEFIVKNEELISGSRIIMLQLEIPLNAVITAVKLSKKHGCTVLLNPAPAPENIPHDILALIDFITPNESELEAMTGISVTDKASAASAAKKLIEKGVKNVIATLGKNGALHASLNVPTMFYSVDDVMPLDTTAAGDTFNGAFAVGLSEGMSITEAICFANKAATICVTRPGAQTSIPSRSEIIMAHK